MVVVAVIVILVVVDCRHAVMVVVSRVKKWLMTEATHQGGAKGRRHEEGGSPRKSWSVASARSKCGLP